MKTMHRVAIYLALAAMLGACSGEDSDTPGEAYDPDLGADSTVAGGKADGIYDIIPEIAFDTDETGNIGGDDVEFYRISLQRTDKFDVTMDTVSGDLSPQVLLYYGASTYVESDSYDVGTGTVTKHYTAGSTGTYLIAARAYRERGEGDYKVRVHCNDGPCAGNFPPPVSDLDGGDIATCIEAAHTCAFAALPAYGGRVGAVRAELILQECLNSASTSSGDSCKTTCDWVNPYEDDDSAKYICDAIIEDLPFYADQDAACHETVFLCMDGCLEVGHWSGSDSEFQYSAIATCWEGPLNGDCDLFAREHATCGGSIEPDTAGECESMCLSTNGAFVDDTSDICGYDADCDSYCDTDLQLASDACGGIDPDNSDCLYGWLDDHNGWVCEDALGSAL